MFNRYATVSEDGFLETTKGAIAAAFAILILTIDIAIRLMIIRNCTV